MLLDGHGIIGAALDGRVVAHDHHVLARNAPHAGNDTRRWRCAVIHVVSGEQANFQKRRSGIKQPGYAVTRQKFAALGVAFARLGSTAPQGHLRRLFHIGNGRVIGLHVGLEAV